MLNLICGKSAVGGNYNSTRDNLPEGLETIAMSAFWHCTQLEHITIPSTVQEIGDTAFAGCENLRTVIIPNTVSNINGSAFVDTPWFSEQTEEFVKAGNTEKKLNMW